MDEIEKFLALKKRYDLSDYFEEFPPMTQEQLIRNVEEANRDIELGRVMRIEEMEKEIW